MQTLSKKVLDQQQIKDVKDAYRYLPSVQGDGVRPQTRGMQGSVVQNHMIDGLNARLHDGIFDRTVPEH